VKESAPRGAGLWIGLALGAPLMAVGVRGALVNADRTNPGELARWLVGSAVVHDAVLLPVVVVVAVVARRLVPARAWPAVRWALATSGIVLLVAWPFVRGYGRRSANPSLLPRNYGLGVAVALAVIWLCALGWIVIRGLAVRGWRRPCP